VPAPAPAVEEAPFDEFLRDSNTTSFIVIQDGVTTAR
jgi:hypothetical protein